jgi:DNA-binding NtrC family response regulator
MEHKTVRLTNKDGSLRPYEAIEDDILNLAVIHCEGVKSRAAKGLRMARSTFYNKLRKGA